MRASCKTVAGIWPSNLDRQWFDGFVIAALALLPKLVDFPAAARVDFAAAATELCGKMGDDVRKAA